MVDWPPLIVDEDLDQDLLAQATRIVRDFCRWHIAPVIEDHIVRNGPGRPVLMLPTLRLVNVAEVVEDDVVVEPERFEWAEQGWLEKPSGRWTTKLRGVTVDCEHGHEETPEPVVRVIRDMVARHKNQPKGGAIRVQTGPFAASYSQVAPNQAAGMALLLHEKTSLLAPYRAVP